MPDDKASQGRDEAAIRRTIDEWLAATGRKDAAASVAPVAEDCVMYTLAPPLVTPAGSDASGLQAWFDTWEGPLDLSIRDLHVETAGDIAYAHGLARMRGDKIGEGPVDLWYRQTLGLRRTDEGWRIVHQHESVPFYMDGSMRAAVDLAP